MPDDTASTRAKNQSETILASPSTCPNKADHLYLLAAIGVERGGSIPARAGKPEVGLPLAECTGVYPRTGGETIIATRYAKEQPGLSPHGRGNPGPGL